MNQRTGPLAGLRVLDLTHVLNGPFCTMLLAHMGADVIKVEWGDGDRFRRIWLPVGTDHDGYEFSVVNANKRAITLNLKHPRGKEIFRTLASRSDVVVENFSIGVMDRLGLGYDSLHVVNPRLIYACSRGYGEEGSYAQVRANAATINAMSGWTASSWEFSGAPGTKAQGIGDEASGVSMALGILAAVYARETTGVGQKLEIPMIEALLGFMVSNFHTYFEHQQVSSPPKRCLDGWVAFHLPDMTDELWESFVNGVGHPEMLEDPRFSSREARRAHFSELESLVAEWVRERSRDELWRLFRQMRISAAPVLNLDEVLQDENLRERETFVQVEDGDRTLTLLHPWIRFSDTPTTITHAGPPIGAHNSEVYRELLGLSLEDLNDLKGAGVI